MTKLKNLKNVFEEQVQDLFSAENQLVKALPAMAEAANDKQLKSAFKSHLKETEGHVQRLSQVASKLNFKTGGKKCAAMEGLIKEAKEALEEESDNPALIDTLLIAAAQRIEHYEISAYGTVNTIADTLGYEEVAEILSLTLEEEESADEKLTDICIDNVLPAAYSHEGEEAEDTDEQEDEDEVEMEVESDDDDEDESKSLAAKSRTETSSQRKPVNR